ncbi:MAG TPA: class I SAM-dependent methyltransferase [Thermoanaerobaculia bacterium]|nr:class I SAM-dependent methyltransferase [Thermoanaerobaculia bacterium]
MTRRREKLLRPAQGRYLRALLSPRDRLLAGIEAEAAAGSSPGRDPAVVRLLELVAAATRARRILELGAGRGDGTLALARGAPEATLVAIEPEAQREPAARELLAAGLVAERVEWRVANPLSELGGLTGPFEIVVLDASRAGARRWLDLALPLLAVRGVVVADRCLGGGRLADPEPEDLDDPGLKALELFNPYLMNHPQLRAVMLPLGDGVAVATKSRPLVRELGGPF